jgi:hypothetical protein
MVSQVKCENKECPGYGLKLLNSSWSGHRKNEDTARITK